MEDTDIYMTICIIITLLVTLFNIVAFVAISKTRRTPRNSRLLSQGLIVVECSFLWCIVARLWANGGILSTFLDRICFSFGIFTQNIVSLMTLERYILFSQVRLFSKWFSGNTGKKTIFAIWMLSGIYFIGRILVCTLVFQEQEVNGRCFTLSGQVYAGISEIVMLSCFIVSCRICHMIRQKRKINSRKVGQFASNDNERNDDGNISSQTSPKKKKKARIILRLSNDEKGSFLVLTYNITILLGAAGMIAYLIRSEQGTRIHFFITALIITVISCILNPCLYVFWFREGRMQLLKFLILFRPSIQTKVDEMRIEVFNIVTISENNHTSKEDVNLDKQIVIR